MWASTPDSVHVQTRLAPSWPFPYEPPVAVVDPPLGHEHVDAPARLLVVLVDGQLEHADEAAALLYVFTVHLQSNADTASACQRRGFS